MQKVLGHASRSVNLDIIFSVPYRLEQMEPSRSSHCSTYRNFRLRKYSCVQQKIVREHIWEMTYCQRKVECCKNFFARYPDLSFYRVDFIDSHFLFYPKNWQRYKVLRAWKFIYVNNLKWYLVLQAWKRFVYVNLTFIYERFV